MNEESKQFGLSDFMFDLPECLVAQHPLAKRDEARLLVRNKDGAIADKTISDLTNLLPNESVLIVNNSRVFPSRLFGKTAKQKKVEVFLLRALSNDQRNIWLAIGKPGRHLQVGTKIDFDAGCSATIVQRSAWAMEFSIEFSLNAGDLASWLDHHGYIPLPPYIHRAEPKPADYSEDRESYQTIYAAIRGSVAAPTAGLHFTESLLKTFNQKGIRILPITLHVGAGTFLPVKHEDLRQHEMHSESFLVPGLTDKALNKARECGNTVIAVGTTSLRCLESYYRACDAKQQCLADSWLDTSLFIYPEGEKISYKPAFLDGLLTNFHQPGSTLFMLISALLSPKEAQRVYTHAIESRYRFLSYGDACLFWL